MAAKKETLPKYEGMINVTKITADDGSVSYLSPSVPLEAEANRVGAVDYAIYEKDGKHVFFLYSETGESKYYLGQKLQNKGYDVLDTLMDKIVCFFSWNPNKSQWVPCVGLSDQPSLRSQAHKLNFSR